MSTGASSFEGTVHPGIALAILEALRETDTPDETLDHETFPRSLPRRLGLSDVVENQIRRYSGMRDRGDALEAQELGELIRLVGRRPDAERVFTGAGRSLARARFRRGIPLARLGLRLTPRVVRRRVLLRRMARIARALSPRAAVRTEGDPPSLVVRGCLPALASASDAGCRLLDAAFEVCAEGLAGGGERVEHSACEGRGAEACRWRLATGAA